MTKKTKMQFVFKFTLEPATKTGVKYKQLKHEYYARLGLLNKVITTKAMRMNVISFRVCVE